MLDTEAPQGSVGSATSDGPFDTLPARSSNPTFDNSFIFDTWFNQPGGSPLPATGASTIPQRMRVKAVRVTVRVWDQKLKLSRQITFVQDL
jgi:hypothetical protein